MMELYKAVIGYIPFVKEQKYETSLWISLEHS